MVLARERLISTIDYFRTADVTFYQFVQDFKDIRYHKGKQQEQTLPSQCPLYNYRFRVFAHDSVRLRYQEQ